MKISPIKTSFNAGIFSNKMAGRVDLTKYASACSECTNFIPTVQGAVIKRPGTKFVGEVKSSSNQTWLASFVFNSEQSFILEFGNQYIRFYNNYSRLADSSSAWNSGTNYLAGNTVTSGGSRYYAKSDNVNKSPASNPSIWYQFTAGIYEVPTPYTTSDLISDDGTFNLSMVQVGDIIYIAHRDHYPRKLSRFSNTRWALSLLDIEKQPFKQNNTDTSKYATIPFLQDFIGSDFSPYGVTTTLTGGDTMPFNGSGTYTFRVDVVNMEEVKYWASQIGTSDTTSVNDMVTNDNKYYGCDQSIGGNQTWYVSPTHTQGSRWDGDEVSWKFLAMSYGIIQVDEGESGSSFSGTVIKQIPNIKPSTDTFVSWAYSFCAWNDDDGYPSQVSFYLDRLVFARDQTLWFSCSGDYENFYPDEFGETLDDSAITINVPFDRVSQITYLSNGKYGLCVGSAEAEAMISSQSNSSPFAPSNVKVDICTHYGSRKIQPIQIDESFLFTQRSGKKIRNFLFDINTNNMVAGDLTVMASDINGSGGIVSMCFTREPYSVLWCARSDGQLSGMTFDKVQDVNAWHLHKIGGDFNDLGYGFVECVQSIPSFDGTQEDLWMIVKRTINGSTKRYVEYMGRAYDGAVNTQADSYYVDCGSTYSGASTGTISGLTWLPNETVAVLANGAVHPNVTVNGSGVITLNYNVTKASVGYPYESIVGTMRFEGGSEIGSAQGKYKKLARVITRLFETANLQIGTGEGEYPYEQMDLRNPNTNMGTPSPIYSGDVVYSLDAPITTDCIIKYKSDTPLPATVLSIVPIIEVYEK